MTDHAVTRADMQADLDLAARPTRVLLRSYAAGELSPVEVVDAVLERMAEVQPALNCFAHLDPVGAHDLAVQSERRWRRHEPVGPIDGVPVTLKENVPVRGVPVTLASAAYADAPPAPADGPPAARTREAGGIITALTTMSEQGMLSSGMSSQHGTTRSPWNPEWTVGGSSGGAAAAAAAGCGPLHSGSDIGGSLRFPATWTGTATLKPTWGRLPVDPPYMGRTIGAIGRTIDDVAWYSQVLAQPDPHDYSALPYAELAWTSEEAPPPLGLRVALLLEAGCGAPVDPQTRATVERAAGLFSDAGAQVTEIEPFLTPELLRSLDLFLRARTWSEHIQLPPDRQDRVLPFVAEWARGAADLSGTEVIRHYTAVQQMRRITVRATLPYDLVLSPVSPAAAFPAEWPMPANDPGLAMDHLGFAACYNFSEQPAASLNAGQTADGRPIGLQIAGRRFADLAVLRAARWFEAARPASARPVWPVGGHRGDGR